MQYTMLFLHLHTLLHVCRGCFVVTAGCKALPSYMVQYLLHGHMDLQIGQYGGFHEELEMLKRDKNVMMMELVRMRQQQQQTDRIVRELQSHVEKTETQQRTMMSFFSAALNNPQMLGRLFAELNSAGSQPRITAGRKKRRGTDADASPSNDTEMDGSEHNPQDGYGAGESTSAMAGMGTSGLQSQIVQYTPKGSSGEMSDYVLSQFAKMLQQAPSQMPGTNGGHASAAPGTSSGVEAGVDSFSNAFDSLQLSAGMHGGNPASVTIDETPGSSSPQRSPPVAHANDSLRSGSTPGGIRADGAEADPASAHAWQQLPVRSAAMAPPTANMVNGLPSGGLSGMGLPAITALQGGNPPSGVPVFGNPVVSSPGNDFDLNLEQLASGDLNMPDGADDLFDVFSSTPHGPHPGADMHHSGHGHHDALLPELSADVHDMITSIIRNDHDGPPANAATGH
eukprot:359188-Chlamydomonas_euryale.AAC.16